MTTILISGSLPAGMYTLTPAGGPTPPDPPDPPIPPQPIPADAFVYPLVWGQSVTIHSGAQGGVQCQQISVFPFTVPLDANSSLYMQWGLSQDPEYGGQATTRYVIVSKTPGSFDVSTAIAYSQGNTVGINLIPGFNVFPGDVLYINEKQWTTDKNPPDGEYSCVPANNINYIMSWIAANQ